MCERTVLLMGAPAVCFPMKLQRVVRAECNPCCCFAVLSLCIFRLALCKFHSSSITCRQGMKKNLLTNFFSQTFTSIHTKTIFLWSAKHCEFVLMHVVPFVFQRFKLWGIFRAKRWTRAFSPVQVVKFCIWFHQLQICHWKRQVGLSRSMLSFSKIFRKMNGKKEEI